MGNGRMGDDGNRASGTSRSSCRTASGAESWAPSWPPSCSAALFGFLVNGATVPGQNDTELIQAVIAIPGALIGLSLSYLWGARMDREHGIDHGHTREGAH